MVKQKFYSYEGFEATHMSIRHNVKMFFYTGLFCFFLVLCGTVGLSYYWYADLWREIFTYFRAVHGLEKLSWGWVAARHMVDKSIWIFLLNLVVVYFVCIWIVVWFKRRAKKQSEDIYVSGAKLITSEELNRAIKRDKKQTYLRVAGINVPVNSEIKHRLVIGRPGVGKTVLISNMINQLRSRGDKGIIYDSKGDFISKFYDSKRDILINPLDVRDIGWNIFSEIRTTMDIDAVSASLIPPAEKEDPFWRDAARAVLTGLIHYLLRNNRRTNAALWEAVTAQGNDIARWLRDAGDGGKAGYIYVQDLGSKQTIGVLSTLQQFTSGFRYMASGDGSKFNITDWIKHHNGWIFVSNCADARDTLRPILSLFIDLTSRAILSLPDNLDRRIQFFIDEFGTLQRLSSLQSLLLLSRSRGTSVTLGIQDIGQVESIYSQALRQTLINACGSTYLFSVSDPDTARFLAEKIGDTEYSHIDRALSFGVEDAKNGTSLGRKEKTKKLILPSEIMNLKAFELFVKLPDYHITRAFLEKVFFMEKTPPFIMREDLRIKETLRSGQDDPLDRLFSSGFKS